MNPFEKLASELKRLKTGYREESYYRPLSEFLEEYANDREFLHMVGVKVTNNPASESVGSGVGFPDMEVKHNRRLIGYIEVKPPTQNLDNPSFSNQFNRYKESLENVVFTNLKTWTLYAWNKDGKSEKIAEANWNYESDLIAEELKKLLTVFFEGESYQAKTPHQLAIALARKTKLLSQQVEDALTAEAPEKRLVDLKKTFEKTLIQDIGSHQFANIYAETIAYSLFLAKLEHFEKGSREDFTIRNAVDYLPKSVPIFKDLYQLTGGTVEPISPEIHNATETLIEQLKFADIEKIYKKLTEHKPGEDPVIQFYEPFLSEYDPEERKARGVYYTPKPVVDYIVRSVDYILKTKFDKSKGLGDESVQILDPATGTGTFLQSIIQNIYADIEKKNKPLGEQAIRREFNGVVSKHILKHIYGFELLVAPYAIAHLKLTLELERLGFNFSMTQDDSDKENDRLKIFLANTLDDPEKPPISLFGFESITEESEKARQVKKDEPILVVTGNPPYSNFGQMNNGEWILNLLKDYKKDLDETKINLDDDFIKFMRFAQWKLKKTGQGIFAMITSNTFIDGITHRQMRRSLFEDFDEMYIYNLHGSKRKVEVSPDGSADENVFPIMTGVSINIFIKYPEKKNSTSVNYSDLWGSREFKFDTLSGQNFKDTNWQTIDVEEFNKKFRQTIWGINFGSDLNFFVQKEGEMMLEYGNYWGVHEMFEEYGSGIKTERDDITIKFDKEEIASVVNDFLLLSEDQLKIKYSTRDTRDWKLKSAKLDIAGNKNKNYFVQIYYRPFDLRWTYYTGKSRGFIGTPGYKITSNFIDIGNEKISKVMNLGLLFKRQQVQEFSYAFVTSTISESCVFESAYANNSAFPLYINPSSPSTLTLLDFEESGVTKKPNLSPSFTKEFSEKLGLEFIYNGQGDLEKTFGPEDVFYYAYAVFHSPTYRNRYAEQLKIDFPRLPLTSNKELFKKLIQNGNELVNLHLLGENPFDKSKTIFDDTSKWNVKIGGEKPADLDDWKVSDIRYDEKEKRVYVNPGQYFEGIEKEVWEFMVGGYQVLDKWLKDRKKAGRTLSPEDSTHYMKIIVSLRGTTRTMKDIDKVIPNWPIN